LPVAAKRLGTIVGSERKLAVIVDRGASIAYE
jgi:hypothetical protein